MDFDQAKALLEKRGAQAKERTKQERERQRAANREKAESVPGLVDLITGLKAAGVKVSAMRVGDEVIEHEVVGRTAHGVKVGVSDE